jgi:hypothetical protein
VGHATNISQGLLGKPVTADEAEDRRMQELELRAPEATLDGQIVDKPEPEVAPVPVTRADTQVWD